MALQNPSFELPGSQPGEAAFWTLTSVTRLEVIAGFGTSPEQAWEDFERWFPLLDDLERVATVRAFFDLERTGVEAFEKGWSNGGYLFTLPPSQLVAAAFERRAAEAFEVGWSNAPYVRRWADSESVEAAFSSEVWEAFESHWRENQSFLRSWNDVAESPARFNDGAASTEDFEAMWPYSAAAQERL